ncbi:MAG: hypothetical protein MI742_03585, partial [Desulfobacterales bacterium]|nr:hypothetical protein [Desulfobacterales bacterium]
MHSFQALPATNPDTPIAPEVSLVIYLDPRATRVPVRSGLYHKNNLMGTGRSGLAFISFNGNNPLGSNWEVTPSLLGALYRATEAINGNLDASTRDRASDYSSLVSLALRFPRIDDDEDKRSEFTHTDVVDRVGFEHEVWGVRITALNGKELERKMVLARTLSTELGLPVFQLELDNLVPPSVLEIKPKGFYFPELVVGPLTTWEYSSPEVHLARKILLDQFQGSKGGITVRKLLEGYNRALKKELGGAWVRYGLKPNETVPIDEIQVTLKGIGAVTYYNQATVLMPYARIGIEKFIDTIDDSHLNMHIGWASHAAQRFLARLKAPAQEVTPELEAFAFQLFFDEMQVKAAGGESASKLSYKVLFRFSREDVVYSILSKRQVRLLASWFEKPSSKIFLKNLLSEVGLPSDSDSKTWKRMINVLKVTAGERLETGRAQLLVHEIDAATYSPVPDDSGRLVLHSHPFAESRRPFVIKDGRYYAAVEYRSNTNDIVKLATDMGGWMDGEGIEKLRSLVEGAFVPDAYAKAASRFVVSSEALVTQRGDKLDAERTRARIAGLLESLPDTPPDLDAEGRIAQVNEGWWRAVYRNGKQLQKLVLSIEDRALSQSISKAVGEGFHVNLDVPQPGFGTVEFSRGRFLTWRGEVSTQELGLPDGWRPGDPLPGYAMEQVVHGVTNYLAQGDASGLPFDFSLTWNGRSWPLKILDGLPPASSMESEIVRFRNMQDDSSLVYRVELPEGGLRLGGDQSPLFAYTVEGLEGILVVMDASDYVNSKGAALGDPMGDWIYFRRGVAALSHTETGREILRKIAGLPRWGADSVPEGTLAGTPLSTILGEERWGGVILLSRETSQLKIFSAPGVPDGLPVVTEPISHYGDSLILTVLNLGRRLGGVAEGIASMPTPPNESPTYYRSKEKLRIENRIAFELGAPFRARVSSSQTD